MRKFVALGVLAAAALGAQSAAAQGFSYNLIEGSYAFADFEGTDLDGFGVKGSAELTPMLHAFGGLQNLGFDGGGDLNTMNLGLGVNFPMSDMLDFVAGVSFERAKVSGWGSESGYGLNAGVRGRVSDNFELAAGLKYADIGDFDDSFTYSAGARWYFTPNFAVGGDYNRIDLGGGDGDAWIVSLRYDFGSRQ